MTTEMQSETARGEKLLLAKIHWKEIDADLAATPADLMRFRRINIEANERRLSQSHSR